MTFDSRLLPPNATALERALEEVMRLPPEVWAAAGKVGDIKIDVPDAAVPFLVWEYGLEPVLPYITDLRQALIDGRAWQRVRGTPAAIAMALAWTGRVATLEEMADDSWWDLYQFGLDQPPLTDDDIEGYVALARLSQAAHTDIIRIYSGYDVREARVNRTTINGGGLVNDWSGVWLRDTWPKLSFGRQIGHISQISSVSDEIGQVDEGGFYVNRDLVNGPEIVGSLAEFGDPTTTPPWRDWYAHTPWIEETWADRPWGMPGHAGPPLAEAMRRGDWWLALGRGDPAWGEAPPDIPDGATSLVDPIAFLRLRGAAFAEQDTGGEIVISDGSRWTGKADRDDTIHVKFVAEFGELVGETIREMALYIGAQPPESTPPGQNLVPAADMISPGAFLAMARLAIPQKRPDTRLEFNEILIF